MAAMDWIFVVGLLASMALGLWRGFVYEVLSVLNWLLAFVLAQWIGEDVGRLLPVVGSTETLNHIAGFVVVFVISVFVGGVVVWGLPKLVERAGLQPVDRGLGALFGLVRAVILTLVLAVAVLMSPLKGQGWWKDSYVAVGSLWTLKQLKPVLPPGVSRYLP